MNNSTHTTETEALAAAVHKFQLATAGVQAYALVYGVAYPRLFQDLRQWFGPDTANSRLSLIFDASSEDGSEQYGPYLVRLTARSSQPSKLLTLLARSCANDFRGVSFLFSSLETESVVFGLRERLDVVCEDRSEWQMKFFDTRSLAVLDRALLPEQRRDYFCIVKEWWYVDRYGSKQKIVGDCVTADSYRGPLKLSEQQTVAFIDAGLPDSVLHSLSLTDDDLIAEFDARTRYSICEESIAQASPEERDSAFLLASRVREALIRAQENPAGA